MSAGAKAVVKSDDTKADASMQETTSAHNVTIIKRKGVGVFTVGPVSIPKLNAARAMLHACGLQCDGITAVANAHSMTHFAHFVHKDCTLKFANDLEDQLERIAPDAVFADWCPIDT